MAGSSPAMTTNELGRYAPNTRCRPRESGDRACATSIPIQFSNSHANWFSRIARVERVVLRPSQRARGLPRSRPQNEGHGAPRGAPCVRFASGIACEAMDVRKRIALRRSTAAILGEGTVLPGADGGGTRPLIRTAFAAFVRSASSRRTAEPHSWPGR